MASESKEPSGSAAAGATAMSEHASRREAALPWVEKYRPDSLSDLVSQGDIVTTRASCAHFGITAVI